MFFKKLYKKVSRKIRPLVIYNYKILTKQFYFKLFFVDKFIIIFNKNIKNNINNIIKNNIINIILNNFLVSYNNLYKKTLILDGVGFKWIIKKKYINIFLGFSHPKIISIPLDLTVNINDKYIYIYSFNKQRLGEYSYFIKSLKLPDNYKGKGIKFLNEKLLIKNVKKK